MSKEIIGQEEAEEFLKGFNIGSCLIKEILAKACIISQPNKPRKYNKECLDDVGRRMSQIQQQIDLEITKCNANYIADLCSASGPTR